MARLSAKSAKCQLHVCAGGSWKTDDDRHGRYYLHDSCQCIRCLPSRDGPDVLQHQRFQHINCHQHRSNGFGWLWVNGGYTHTGQFGCRDCDQNTVHTMADQWRGFDLMSGLLNVLAGGTPRFVPVTSSHLAAGSGTDTIPIYCTGLTIENWGGSGGGAGGTGSGCGASAGFKGASGGYCKTIVAIIPADWGKTINWSNGAAGTAGVGTGGAGGASAISSGTYAVPATMNAGGGAGAVSGTGGGAGGTASGGNTTNTAGNAAGPGGTGNGIAGTNGTGNGGGSAGGVGTGHPGGAGGSGQSIFRYT